MAIYGQCPSMLPSGQCQRYANHRGEHRPTMGKPKSALGQPVRERQPKKGGRKA